MRKTFDFIFLFKAIGIIMITNSHFKPVYDGGLKQLAFGGALGCSLFFFCSGFTMANGREESFWLFLKRRIIKIIPPLWFFLLISGDWNHPEYWVCWGHYWFLQTILVFYVIFYYVRRYLLDYLVHIIVCLLGATCLVYYLMPHSEWMIDYTMHQNRLIWLYYFAIMIMGAKLRISPSNKKYRFELRGNYNTILRLIIVPLIIAFVYGLKKICVSNPQLINLQLLFPIMLLLSCYMMYIFFSELQLRGIWKCVTIWLSTITLEIYIVQFWCIRLCSPISPFFRPFCVCFLILSSAYVLHMIIKLSIGNLISMNKTGK